MGYQALLFCPDEKLSSVVSQVFGELDFTVESVQEPFVAVKKLMAQRYDAIVVDSDNDQNASLLLKSARNSSSNHSSLAIALVEGQAGIAKADRIGANLVLTKPINVEQAKGTLRVARGLLRKTSDGAANAAGTTGPATTASATSVSTATPFQLARASAIAISSPSTRNQTPSLDAAPPVAVLEGKLMDLPIGSQGMTAAAAVDNKPATPDKTAVGAEASVNAQQTASREAMDRVIRGAKGTGANNTDAVESRSGESRNGVKNGVKNEAGMSSTGSLPTRTSVPPIAAVGGSAAATAPAKEVSAAPVQEIRIAEEEHAGSSNDNPSHPDLSQDATASHAFDSAKTSDVPSFAALGEQGSGSHSNKAMLIAAGVIVALAALGYIGYGMFGKGMLGESDGPAAPVVSTSQASGRSASVPAPLPSPSAVPSTNTPDPSAAATHTLASRTATTAPSNKLPAVPGNASAMRNGTTETANVAANVVVNPELEARKTRSSPLLVKSNPAITKAQARTEEAAPQLPGSVAVAAANENNLTGLISSSASRLPKLSLTTLKISQGVSEGLLVKRVEPKYPQTALASHAHGMVQIEATINKEGIVTNPKVLNGNPVLAQAALEAVRQWRYKPYRLDGQPVEIQTQITINFKSN